MNDVLLGIGVAVFTLYAAFNIVYILSVKRMTDRLDIFLRNTEGNLNEALTELKKTLENAKKVTGDVSSVTADVREIADAVVGLERGVRDLYRDLKEDLGRTAEANFAGLKAGIATGVATLVKNLQEERRDDHEGRTGEN